MKYWPVKFLADPPLMGSALYLHLCVCPCMCACVCVISWLNCLISLVLDEIYFWNLLETFLWCLYTISKKLQISCMCVSLFLASLPYWKLVISGYLPSWMRYISEIFWRLFLDVCTPVANNYKFLVYLLVC